MSAVTDDRVLDYLPSAGEVMDDDHKRAVLSTTLAACVALSLAICDLGWAIADALDIWRVCDRVDGRWRWK